MISSKRTRRDRQPRYQRLESRRRRLARWMSRDPRLEPLEDRRVLASVGLAADVLVFNNDGVEDNDVTVSVIGGNLTLRDANQPITAGNGVTQVDSNTVAVPVSALSRLEVNASGGADRLTIDHSGDPLSFDIDYIGGEGFDDLAIEGGHLPELIYNATGVGAGNVEIGGSTVEFDGLEPVSVTSSVGTLTINITDAAGHEIVLQDVPGINDSQVTIDGGLEDVTFTNPSNQLTIHAGDGEDTIIVRNLETTFAADILLDGGHDNDLYQIVPSLAAPIFIDGGPPAQNEPGFPPGDVLALDLDNVVGASVNRSQAAGVVTSLSHAQVTWIDVEQLITPDRFELNDSIELATVLGSLPKITLNELSIHPRLDQFVGVPYVDVVVVVDESQSMETKHPFLQEFIPDLELALTGVGIGIGGIFGGNQYGLVGFGGDGDPVHLRGHSHLVGGSLFGTAAEFATATGTLVITGEEEDGYDGIQFALDNYPFRPDAARLVVLVTDEDRDVVNATLTKASVGAAIQASEVTLHGILNVDLEDGVGATALAVDADGTAYIADGGGGVIISSGGVVTAGAGNTIDDYVDLVFDGEGLVGDLNQLAGGGDTSESFSTAMLIDLIESIEIPPPEPDVDVFKYTAQDTGKLIINALFDHSIGDVDLRVRDTDGNIIASSTTSTDNEQIVIPVVSQEMYFIEVEGFEGAVNNYDLELENFAAPVPTDVTLDPNDDSGMMNNDLITSVDDARLFVKADLRDFENMGITILDAAQAIAGNTPGAAVEVFVNGASVGFADPFLGLPTLFEFTLDQTGNLDPDVGQWSQNIPITTGSSVAVDNAGYFNIVQAAVRIFDGQDVTATARTQMSQELDVHFDPNTPDATLITLDMLDASDTGANITDNVTNKMQPAFQGVAEENTKVRLYADLNQDGDPELVGTAVTGSDSSDVGVIAGASADDGLALWEITVQPLQDGTYDISIEMEDIAGNSTNQADGPMIIGLVVDTLTPQRPTVDLVGTDVQDDLANVDDLPAIVLVAPIPSDTGLSTSDSVTYGVDPQNPGGDGTTDVQLRISAEPLSDVFVKDGEEVIANFVMPDEPFVFLYLDDILDEDPHPISVEAFDPAGNRSAQSEELLVTIDVTPPPAPSIPDLNASSDSGMDNSDNVTNIQAAHFTGTAEANGQIRIYAVPVAGHFPAALIGVPQLVGQGTVGSDESDGEAIDGLGLYEVTIEPLEDAVYDIIAEVEDKAGNISQRSEGLRIEIDTIEPNTPFLDLVEASDSGRHDDDNVTNDDTPTVTMTTHDENVALHQVLFTDYLKFRIYDRLEESDEVLLYASAADAAVDAVSTGGDGFTSLTLVTETLTQLADGFHNLKLEVEDRAGNISHDFLLDLLIDTVAYQGDVHLHPESDSGVWGYGATMLDRITSDKVPDFFGVAEANNLVTVTIDGDLLAGTTMAIPLDGDDAFQPQNAPYQNVEGNWQIATVENLTDGEHTVVATFEDLAGNRIDSEELEFFVDTVGPRITAVEVNEEGHPYDLFDPKPSTDGPTPPVDALVISVSDLPARTVNFLYDPIFAPLANEPGHYQLVGDDNGIIPIDNVIYSPLLDVGDPATATITLTFDEPLPDDRYTLTISDSLTDVAGNALDGESNASEPQEFPNLPSGDGVHGGDFVARFTVDSRPEIATWSQGVVYADINGNFVWDPDGEDNDYTNRDFVFNFGEITDAYFAGNFASAEAAFASGFDKLGAYGAFNGQYQFFLDTDDDGVGDTVGSMAFQVNAIPVAGNFDGGHPGDEIGAFDGQHWYLDTDGNNHIDSDEQFSTALRGIPVVGDFNGDGSDDLATYNNDTGVFQFDLDRDGTVDDQLTFGFSGFGEKPVAGDINLDGIDDIVMWVPKQEGQLPKQSGEFHFLVSDDFRFFEEYEEEALPSNLFAPFSPEPLGNDLIAQFGDEFALPLFGNFDPPIASDGGTATSIGSLTNLDNPLDTTGDGEVTARDALVVINALGRDDFDPSGNPLRVVASLGGFRLDASGDGTISSLDALRVINGLARQTLASAGGSLAAEQSQAVWASSADSVLADVGDDEDDLLALLAADQAYQRVK